MEGVKIGCANEGEIGARRPINAGIDILLDVADPVGTLAALEQAVAAGRTELTLASMKQLAAC